MLDNKYEYWFKLLKPIDGSIYKVGKQFDSFGGLVSGVGGIGFNDTQYFKLIKKKRKDI